MKSRFENHSGSKQNVFSKNSRRTQRTTRKNIFLRSLPRDAHYEQVQIFKYDFIKVKKMFFQITPVLCLLCCNRKRGCSLRKYFCRWKSTYNFFARCKKKKILNLDSKIAGGAKQMFFQKIAGAHRGLREKTFF